MIIANLALQVLSNITLIHQKSDWFLILSSVGFIIIIALLLYWMLKQQKKWAITKFSAKRKVVVSILGFFIMVVIERVCAFLPRSANQRGLNTILANADKTSFIIFSCLLVIVSVIEEFIFRFMIIGPNPIGEYKESKKIYYLRIIISSLLFGAWHLRLASFTSITNVLLTSIPYVMMGLILACIYSYTQDIRVSIATHMGINLFPTIMLLIISIF